MKKKIVVTGSAGFIGRHIAETLLAQNKNLILVDHIALLQKIPEFQNILQFSIEDFLKQPADFFQECEAIIHMGAITDTTCQDEKALNYFNLHYSQKLWEICTQNKIGLLYASSAATYGDGKLGYQESTILPLQPLNLYGWSKQKFDLWALEQPQTPLFWAGFKFFNVYGPYEQNKKFMASVITKAYEAIQKTGKVNLFKSHKPGILDGEQKRDFIYVQDVVNVILFGLSGKLSGIYNVGTGEARTFLDLVKAVFAACNKKEAIEFIDMPLELQDKYQYFTQADIQKLRKSGYLSPMTSLEEGAKKTVLALTKKAIS
jgi:ADP-L-glycero-D-manno-heptose 6-epimerase